MTLNSREVDNQHQHHKWQALGLEAPLKSFWQGDPRASCRVQLNPGLDEEGKEPKSPQEGRVLRSGPTAQAGLLGKSRWPAAPRVGGSEAGDRPPSHCPDVPV